MFGRLREPRKIDADGYQAVVDIEQVLAGSIREQKLIRLGWEELSAARAPRFRDGDRIVLALAPLPTASLWQGRFPDARRGDVYIVAEEGDAYLLHPDKESLEALSSYFRVSWGESGRADAVAPLARMIARAAPEVAVAAASELVDMDLASPLPEAAEAALGEALVARQQPQLRSLIIELAARHRIKGMRSQLQQLGDSDANLGFNALMAVAAIDGSMPDAQAQTLLYDPNPVRRLVAVRLAHGAIIEQILPLLRTDPDARVRAEVARTLIEQRGTAALSEVLRALSDPDAFVRTETARRLGQLGRAVVPALAELAKTAAAPTAMAVVLALESTGAAGAEALHELAENHPDASVRRLAKLARGKLEDEH